MSDNTHKYGFRPVKGAYAGASHPKAVRKFVASGYQAQDDGSGFSVDLNVGDPVKLVNDGSIALANTTNSVWGVIVGFGNYYNAANGRMEPTDKLPGGSTWTGDDQRPWVYVVPTADHQLFEIDVDDATTATTLTAYLALVGENCTHVCPGNSTTKKAEPRLDISLHATTESLVWRIEDVSMSQENQDFSGANVKLIVSCNETQHAGQAATNNAGV